MTVRRHGLTLALCSLVAAASLTACSSERSGDTSPADDDTETTASADGTAGGLVGVSMPTRSLQRWNNDGQHLTEVLADLGYETTLQYADNKIDQQITQLQNMINEGVEVLVIAPIDGTALGPVLASAKEAGITVFAYDRLINDTPDVDYLVTFDNFLVGQLQGEYIVEQLGLEDGEGPFTFEPFAGSPDDPNAAFFFEGAWNVLSPYIDSGQLVVPSGKAPAAASGWASIGIQSWESATAQSEMENRINSFYAADKVDVILSPNDSVALGIAQALEGAGYTAGVDWPILTGQDADKANVLNIIAGKQSMTVWKDTRDLGDQVAAMVDQVIKGETVEVTDTETYDNNARIVPTYLLVPQPVTAENFEEKLVGSGFYAAADLGL